MGEQIAEIRSSPEAAKKEQIDEEIIVHEGTQSPWQTGMNQRQPEEARPSEKEVVNPQSEPRRSTRIRKPNPEYANAVIAEEDNLKEPDTYEEVS